MRRLALPVAALCGLAVAVVPALAANQTVSTVAGNDFSPARVAVKPGEKVTIHNGSRGLHDLNWADGATGQPVENTTDWSTERTFDAAGEFVFYCDVHGDPSGGMRGTVYVNDAGTVPDGGGGGGGGTQTATNPGGTTTSTTPPPGETVPPGGTQTATTGAPPADTSPPRATGARVSATRRAVVVRATLSEPAKVTVRVLRRGRRLARRVFDAQAGKVTLRIRRPLRRGRHSVRLTLVDAAGNRATRALSARVK